MKLAGKLSTVERIRGLADANMQARLGKALFAAGEVIQVEAQISLTRGSASAGRHVPSLPGAPPNQDTGHLGGNIETVALKPLVVEVSSNASYSRALEYGTSKMAERPFMRPAVEKTRPEVRARVAAAIKARR